MKNRGFKDIFVACIDGLTGFADAINTAYPESKVQLCVVLKSNRKIQVRGRMIRADEFATTIPREDRKELRRGDRRQWYIVVPEKMISLINAWVVLFCLVVRIARKRIWMDRNLAM